MNTKKIVSYLVEWLTDYAQSAGVNGFVVGISGGVDSAVVSALCARTGLTTLCVELSIHQASSEVARAQKHMNLLQSEYKNVQQQHIELSPVFEAFKMQAPQKAGNELALANTRSRLRMAALYYLAGLEGLLVVGTGNKVEDFGVGFFTKYGDGGVDISPIADLTKTQVYALAKELNIIPEIQTAQPTDGLFGDSRTDEDQLGATYPELEWAMQMVGQHKTPDDFSGREQEVMKIYISRNKANQHKMQPIPVALIPSEWKE